MMMSPAFTPRLTASLPHTARKVIFSPLTEASTATTLGSLSRRKSPMFRRRPASASGTVAVRTFRPPTSWAEKRNRSASPRASLARNFSRDWRSSFISVMMCSALSRSSPGLAFRAAAAWKSISWLRFITSRDACPVVASMRRTPEATENSLEMWNTPALAVLSRWVPPQNSTEYPPMSTTRTVSPYFSPNRAVAPVFLASSMSITLVSTGYPSRMDSFTRRFTSLSSSGVMAEKWVKSKRRKSGSTREPA